MTKRERLVEALQREGLEVALLSAPEDVCYATGFEVPPPIDAGAAFAAGPPLALVYGDGTTVLLVPNAYADGAAGATADETTSYRRTLAVSMTPVIRN